MDIAEYTARIEAARDNETELGHIADELQTVVTPWAGFLRMRAIVMRKALRQTKPVLDADSLPAQAHHLSNWLSDIGLPAIDGRPLYRYRLSDQAFEKLQANLENRAASLSSARDRVAAAQFVLWAAEWFRRCYDGTGQRWEALGKPLGLQPTWDVWRKLTDDGLRHWGIAELRINGTHHRLAAIARQGGFPLAAVEGVGSGWAPRFLERLVSLLLAETEATLDVADTIASSLMELVPVTWRNQEIRIVSAELALDVARLRRLAEADGIPDGALVSAWLDQYRPDWRSELPITVSSDAGRALVDGLLKTAILKGGAGAVTVRRRLVIDGLVRKEITELKLAGNLQDVNGTSISRSIDKEWSRLRLFPSGDFAKHMSGELATAEPGDDGIWIARPTTTRTTFDLPFAVAVEAELRGSGQRVGEPFVLPAGGAVTGNVRVYVATNEVRDMLPTEFQLIGTGSGSYRPDRIYLDLPAAWRCAPSGDGSRSERLPEHSDASRSMWLCEGNVIAASDRDDRYLLRTSQTAEQRDKLILMGSDPRGCGSSDSSMPIFVGMPVIQLRDGRRNRAPNVGEVYWRERGANNWRPISKFGTSAGNFEFAWRDSTTLHIRDRVDACILPQGFEIGRRRVGDVLEINISGWQGRVLVDGHTNSGKGFWRFPLKANSRSCCTATLMDGLGGSIEVEIPLPHYAWIYDWSLGPVERKGRISLSTINRYVARSEGRCELLADLLDREGRPVAQGIASWWVEGELPLSSISDDIAALLRPLGDIRAEVRLNFNDSHDNVWCVREFDHNLERDSRGWLPDRAVIEPDVNIVGRALHDPARERRDFGAYGLLSEGQHRPFELPTLHGDWLIYLRSNDHVLSCPQFIRGRPLTAAPSTALAKAMAITEYTQRISALKELCDELNEDAVSPASRAMVRYVIDLALSLDGLPPSTFDILLIIKDRPLLGCLMLFQALPAELDTLMRLPEGLPMAWTLIPGHYWEEAARAQAEYLFTKVPDGMALVAQMISDRRKQIAEVDPTLTALLGFKGEYRPLSELANEFINRSHDRISNTSNPFRSKHEAALPAWVVGEHFWRALDAPVAAAKSVLGQIDLAAQDVTCIKDISRNHPRWFREAFIATLKESNE